jgi:uncharacterized membrane protein YqjE
LKTKNQNWKKEVELESDERIISHCVRTLENRLNKLEIELEEFKNKVECEVKPYKILSVKNNL